MTEEQAYDLVETWDLDRRMYDVDGCVEDLMDGWNPDEKEQILDRNEYLD